MKLEYQVCSIELAKRLNELGIKQDSLFWWSSFRNESSPKDQWGNIYSEILTQEEKRIYKERIYLKDKKFYSAFTVSELGELLPWDITISRNNDKQWNIHFMGDGLPKIISERSSIMSQTSESNSRAKLLIYLIENNLYNPTQK